MSYESQMGGGSEDEQGAGGGEHVRLLLSDDLERSRLTVFFRLLLALPHLLWLGLWGILAALAMIVNWFATLILGRCPAGLHRFLSAYVRYAIHVGAYLFLAANPFPGFLGEPGYPVDVEIPPPGRQSRWTVLFRIVLGIPAALIAAVLSSSGARTYGVNYGIGLLGVVSFLGWFAALGRGRMPRGLRDAMAYALSYTAQLDAYLFLLTDRYPSSDPLSAIGELPERSDPIALEVDEQLRRSRLTVFFRLLLALPHLVWLTLWSILAYLLAIVNWLATLILGRSPDGLHRFLAAFLRYRTHVYAYLFLIGNPFPGFTGEQESYPVALTVAGPQPQSRWKTLLRLPLALPALLIASAYGSLLYLIALLGWFASLANGSMPGGLRNAGALALRYRAQTSGYLLLLTDAYPYSGPVAPARQGLIHPESGPPAPQGALAGSAPQ